MIIGLHLLSETNHRPSTNQSINQSIKKKTLQLFVSGPGVCYDCPQSKMAQQFAFFKDGLSDESFVKYMDLVQEEVANFFEQEWGDEGEADLLQSLSDLFTLTSSRCLLGDEIRTLWKASGMAEHYCK